MLLASERSGTGPSLVLVHGITESRETWRPLIPALAARFDVLAVDLRGHGESPLGDRYDPMTMAGDIHETVVAAGITDPILVGHSLGGVVVTAYATLFGARGVMNVDQPLNLAGFKDGLTQLEPMLRGDQASFEQAISMIFESMQGALADDEIARVGDLRRPVQDVVLGIWASVLESSVAELDATVDALCAGVSAPYVALHGIDAGLDYPAWLVARIPSATIETWPEAGHYPHLVEPARFLNRLDAFAASLA